MIKSACLCINMFLQANMQISCRANAYHLKFTASYDCCSAEQLFFKAAVESSAAAPADKKIMRSYL